MLELDRAEERLSTNLCVRLRAEEASRDRLLALRKLLLTRPGECAVTLHLVIPDESETVMSVAAVRGVRPDPGLRRDVDDLFGRAVTELSL